MPPFVRDYIIWHIAEKPQQNIVKNKPTTLARLMQIIRGVNRSLQ